MGAIYIGDERGKAKKKIEFENNSQLTKFGNTASTELWYDDKFVYLFITDINLMNDPNSNAHQETYENVPDNLLPFDKLYYPVVYDSDNTQHSNQTYLKVTASVTDPNTHTNRLTLNWFKEPNTTGIFRAGASYFWKK